MSRLESGGDVLLALCVGLWCKTSIHPQFRLAGAGDK
jgi:hypothetical protein